MLCRTAPGPARAAEGIGVFEFGLVTHRNRWQYRIMINQGLQNEIVARLSAKKPLKVILFGSRAGGEFDEGSDVDLFVVLDKEGIPRTFKEKTENFLEVNRLLRDLNKRVAMDLVVMTRTQWERFIEMDSGFSREVQEKGLLLI
jgi:predicted nucleotidyltransferase